MMDIIWAPWRLEYVKAPHNNDAGGKCIFCEFPSRNDDAANHIFLRREHCFGMLNRYPYNNGHLLIAPYKHISGLNDISDEIMAEVMTTVRDCVEAHNELVHPHGFNIGLNLGTAAGAGIADHVHWHIVPRWQGDTNFMPVVGDTKVMPQSLRQMYEQISNYFSKR